MIRFFYLAPQAAFDGLTNANHRAVRVTVNVSFGFVDFVDGANRDAFNALPNVIELPHHRTRGQLPGAVASALAAHGVISTDGAVDVALKIAAKFGGLPVDEILRS